MSPRARREAPGQGRDDGPGRPGSVAARRPRHSAEPSGRHRVPVADAGFSRGFRALAALAGSGARVSASAVDLATGADVFAVDDHVVMPASSLGTVLLLTEVAAEIGDGTLDELEILDREPSDAAGGAGVWQHLQAPALPIADLAALVGAHGDALAVNVLLRRIGLEAVARRAAGLGLVTTALLDRARDARGPDDAPELALGSARELAWLLGALARGEVVDRATSARVVSWLSLGTDLSLVAAAFGLDPLAHREPEHGILLVNRTGSAPGVRAEAGVLRGPGGGVAYAVLCAFDDDALTRRLAVAEALRTLGLDLLDHVH